MLCCPRHEEDALLSARIAHALRELRPSGLRVVRMWLSCCGIPELLERIQTEEGAAVPSVISTLSRAAGKEAKAFLPRPFPAVPSTGYARILSGGFMSGHRAIIRIDEELCNGCGACLPSCAEGALRIENGQAAPDRRQTVRRSGRVPRFLPARRAQP